MEGKDRSRIVPLYDFVKNSMLTASVTALLGPEILKLNPDFGSIYWAFEETFPLMAAGLSKILYWRGHSARTRMLDAVKVWISAAWEKIDKIDAEVEWEENFGSRYIREMLLTADRAGFSREGQASMSLPLIWGQVHQNFK